MNEINSWILSLISEIFTDKYNTYTIKNEINAIMMRKDASVKPIVVATHLYNFSNTTTENINNEINNHSTEYTGFIDFLPTSERKVKKKIIAKSADIIFKYNGILMFL